MRKLLASNLKEAAELGEFDLAEHWAETASLSEIQEAMEIAEGKDYYETVEVLRRVFIEKEKRVSNETEIVNKGVS